MTFGSDVIYSISLKVFGVPGSSKGSVNPEIRRQRTSFCDWKSKMGYAPMEDSPDFARETI
jgi:hypothetical protein